MLHSMVKHFGGKGSRSRCIDPAELAAKIVSQAHRKVRMLHSTVKHFGSKGDHARRTDPEEWAALGDPAKVAAACMSQASYGAGLSQQESRAS